MAHHGLDEGSEIARRLFAEHLLGKARQIQQDANQLGLGPTGQFPEGHLNDDDEGEIKVGITHSDGKVVIHFGKPVAWIGFTPEQAYEIAQTLIEHAAKVS